MNSSIRITLAAILILLSSSIALSRASDPFEGTWKIQATPDGSDGKPFDDVLTFKGGQFVSQEMTKRGFKVTGYDEDTRGRTTATFVATAKSDKGGEMKWTGSITGPAIRGDIDLTKPDGTSVHYTYTGERSGK